MVLHIRLIHVGSSSYSIQLELIDKELKDVLIESTRTFALMDKKTGRSKPLPGYMRYVAKKIFTWVWTKCCSFVNHFFRETNKHS